MRKLSLLVIVLLIGKANCPSWSQTVPLRAGDANQDLDFDQYDIIAVLNGETCYCTGPYAAITSGGTEGDDQTSLVYDAANGELSVDPAAGKELTSINITSEGNKFIGDKPPVLDGSFDNFDAGNIFRATFGDRFSPISFGNVSPAGISYDDVLADLLAVGVDWRNK